MSEIRPGTIAVDWENQVLYIRAFRANLWHDTRNPGLGAVRITDEWITERCEIIQPVP